MAAPSSRSCCPVADHVPRPELIASRAHVIVARGLSHSTQAATPFFYVWWRVARFRTAAVIRSGGRHDGVIARSTRTAGSTMPRLGIRATNNSNQRARSTAVGIPALASHVPAMTSDVNVLFGASVRIRATSPPRGGEGHGRASHQRDGRLFETDRNIIIVPGYGWLCPSADAWPLGASQQATWT